jgi:hypothetical protein
VVEGGRRQGPLEPERAPDRAQRARAAATRTSWKA